MKASESPNNPSNQSFNIRGRKNLTKKNSWWAHAPWHNNGSKK